MKVNEESIKSKYKYYKADMLQSILEDNKNLSSEEVAIIEGIIREKTEELKSNIKNERPIIYSALKDKLIIATRWHILIFAASIFISFIYRQRYYPWGWIEAFVACSLVFSFGILSASLIFIFLTEKSKGKFYGNYIKFSLIGVVLLWVANWNYCRISYTCN